MFKKIVKFKDGTYGLRKWTLFDGFTYKDFSSSDTGHWWKIDSGYINDCKTTFTKVIAHVDKGKPLSKKEIRDTKLITALKG